MKNKFPFVSLHQALLLVRIMTAIFFMAHAVVRIIKGTIPQFGAYMESQGFPEGVMVVWVITMCELVAGSLMIANRYVRISAAVLFAIAFTGIILIHRHLGWFVGEHGTGGAEYSVALMVLLLVVAAAERERVIPARL
jgi:putative oxidoreductase